MPQSPVRGTAWPPVWTGSELLVWGEPAEATGKCAVEGGAYDPGKRAWRSLAPSPLEPLFGASVVWTGREMIVWGGRRGDRSIPGESGAAYNPAEDSWHLLPLPPIEPRADHAAVWTGKEMIVWGGALPDPADYQQAPTDGAAYDPTARRWRTIASAPIIGRSDHSALWTGREVLVWGGNWEGYADEQLADGALYDPGRDEWRTVEAPRGEGRSSHAAVWTGDAMLVSGGFVLHGYPLHGALAFDPVLSAWSLLPDPPFGRTGVAHVWTGRYWWLWGGDDWHGDDLLPEGGAVYDPDAARWAPLPAAPIAPRMGATAVWTGPEVLLWGGQDLSQPLADGAVFRFAGTTGQ